MPIDDSVDFLIQIMQPQPMLKWTKTAAEIGIIGESPPVFCDVDGDGIKEIFWAGKPYDNIGSKYAILVCIDGLTGDIRWSKPYLQYWGDGNKMKHLPVMVYDFDKDGQYEVIAAGASICRDALTGEIKWTSPNNYFGWHNNAFIDYGSHVTLYTAGGGYLSRVNGADGTLINRVLITYTCWGGVSIADINHDGQWDIVVTSRGYLPYKGLQLYSEDLSVLRWNKMFTCSSQTAKIYDIDGDGEDEIIAGRQAGANSRIHIVKYDGTYTTIGPLSGMGIHVEPTVGDCDNDGHMEFISCDSSNPTIVDLVTGTLKATIPHHSFFPPDIADVLPYAGYEIISTAGDARIYRHDGNQYVLMYTLSSGVYFSVTGDVDGDGYNEFVLAGSGGMSVWDTSVPTPDPEPINLIAFGGMRRLNNNIYYPLPMS